MNVVGYIRVSTEEQAENGHSLEAQETLIRQFAAARGWCLVRIYCDSGLSGRSDKRPDLARLLSDAEAGHFDAVVVHAIDRLYRNLEGLLKALQLFQRHGIAFVSITENLDFTTPWGKLTLAVLGTLAEIYIDKLSAETSKGKQQRAREGQWNGSIPLGYCNGRCSTCTDPNGPGYCPYVGESDRSTGDALVPHPVESAAIALAFSWYTAGDRSDGDIAEKLNATPHVLADGSRVAFRTKREQARGGPGPFGKDSVRDILTRVFYTGVVPYYGTDKHGRKRKRRDAVAYYPGQHPALIDQETFDRAQEIRRLLSRHPRQRHQTVARVYPLSGLLYCGECKGKMRAQGGSNGRSYYVCTTRLQHLAPCRQSAVPAEQIEGQLYDLLKDLDRSASWQRDLTRELGQDPDERDRAEAEIKARLARAAELYLGGLISRERLDQEERTQKTKLAELAPQSEAGVMATAGHLRTVQEHWMELPDVEKRKLLRELFSAAFVQGNAISAVQPTDNFYPLAKTILLAVDCFYSGSDGYRGSLLVKST